MRKRDHSISFIEIGLIISDLKIALEYLIREKKLSEDFNNKFSINLFESIIKNGLQNIEDSTRRFQLNQKLFLKNPELHFQEEDNDNESEENDIDNQTSPEDVESYKNFLQKLDKDYIFQEEDQNIIENIKVFCNKLLKVNKLPKQNQFINAKPLLIL